MTITFTHTQRPEQLPSVSKRFINCLICKHEFKPLERAVSVRYSEPASQTLVGRKAICTRCSGAIAAVHTQLLLLT